MVAGLSGFELARTVAVEFAATEFELLADRFAQNLLLELAEAAFMIVACQIGIGAGVNFEDWQPVGGFERSWDASIGHQDGERTHAIFDRSIRNHFAERAAHAARYVVNERVSQRVIGQCDDLAPQGNRQVGVGDADLTPSQIRQEIGVGRATAARGVLAAFDVPSAFQSI